jgi:hypothetical protein
MTDGQVILQVDGEVESARSFTRHDLAAVDDRFQIADVSQIDPKRKGRAVRLEGVLDVVQPKTSARYLTLHASLDDFHASVPLDMVRETGLFIYEKDNQPLEAAGGGPLRFYIKNFADCHSSEVDECANVKFVDRIELTAEKGHDNRPSDDDEHQQLHRQQEQ